MLRYLSARQNIDWQMKMSLSQILWLNAKFWDMNLFERYFQNYKVDFAMKKIIKFLKRLFYNIFSNTFIFLHQKFFNENYKSFHIQVFLFLGRKPAFIKLLPKTYQFILWYAIIRRLICLKLGNHNALITAEI